MPTVCTVHQHWVMFATHVTLIFPPRPRPPLTHDTSPSVDDDQDQEVSFNPCHKELGASTKRGTAAAGTGFIWLRRT